MKKHCFLVLLIFSLSLNSCADVSETPTPLPASQPTPQPSPTSDVISPEVVSTFPKFLTYTPIDTTPINTDITITFSEAMDVKTITAQSIRVNDGKQDIEGKITYADATVTFTPAQTLESGKMYTIFLEDSISDLTGNTLEESISWQFITKYRFTRESRGLISSIGDFGAAGDLDQDGDIDVVVADLDELEETDAGRQGKITIYINDGAGFFSDKSKVWFEGKTMLAATRGIALVDVNLDGFLDIVLATEDQHFVSYNKSYKDRILVNHEGKYFRDETDERLPYDPVYSHSVCSGDVNADGAPDLFFAYQDKVMINDGAGFYLSKLNLPWMIGSIGGTFADVDQDGDDDLIVITDNVGITNYLLYNDGQGNFSLAPDGALPPKVPGEPTNVRKGNTTTMAVTTGDFNEDGYPDIVIGNFFNILVPPKTRDDLGEVVLRARKNQLFINNGDGTFRDETENGLHQSLGGGIVWSVVTDDLNSDNHLDIIFSYVYPVPGMFVYYGHGDGTFTEAGDEFSDGFFSDRPEGWGDGGLQVIVFDMDNDGDKDIFFTGSYVENYAFINTTYYP